MKTSSAGRAEANIIQMGKWECKPSGCMNQPRVEGLDTSKPSGTLSFCGREMLVRTLGQGIGKGGDGEPGSWVVDNLLILGTLYSVPTLSLLHISHFQLYR